jgi:predicted nuclease with TOPRIM domain
MKEVETLINDLHDEDTKLANEHSECEGKIQTLRQRMHAIDQRRIRIHEETQSARQTLELVKKRI